MFKMPQVLTKLAALLTIVPSLVVLPEGPQAGERMADQLVIQMHRSMSVDELVQGLHGEPIDTIPRINAFLVRFFENVSLDSLMEVLKEKTGVVAVQPNFIVGMPEVNQFSQSFPDESRPPYVSGESPPNYYGQPGDYSLEVDSAHTVAIGSGVVVAVIDNGIDFSHALFAGALEDDDFDFIGNDSDPSEESGTQYGHGTFVAGLVLLTAPGCTILPLRSFDASGQGTSFSVADAIYYAMQDSVDIINMSFGTYDYDLIIANAVQDAFQQGIALIASVGNDSTGQSLYPADFSQVLAVTAIDTSELVAGFANFGAYLDICAPGVDVYSSLAGEFDWGTWSGTSFSTAFISGVCALVIQAKPTLTVTELYQTIRYTARVDLAWGTITPPDIHYGYGLVDAYNAVTSTRCGDMDGSFRVTVADITYLTDYLFNGGPAPVDPVAANADASREQEDAVNIGDLTFIVEYLFLGGPAPRCQ